MLYFIYDAKQILTILIINHRLCKLTYLLLSDPSLTISDFLKARQFKTLTFLKHFYISRSLGKRIMSTCIKSCKSTSKSLHLQLAVSQKLPINGRNLVFTSGRRFYVMRDIYYFIRIKVQPHYSIIALWHGWLFFNAQAVAFSIELRHSISLWIAYPISENCSIPLLFSRTYGFL